MAGVDPEQNGVTRYARITPIFWNNQITSVQMEVKFNYNYEITLSHPE